MKGDIVKTYQIKNNDGYVVLGITVNNGSGYINFSMLHDSYDYETYEAVEYELYLKYEAAIDGIEALAVAQACAGINLESEKYQESFNATIQAITENFS